MPSRSAAKAFNETGGNWRKAFTSTVPELESNDFCYFLEKFPATQWRARRARTWGASPACARARVPCPRSLGACVVARVGSRCWRRCWPGRRSGPRRRRRGAPPRRRSQLAEVDVAGRRPTRRAAAGEAAIGARRRLRSLFFVLQTENNCISQT